MKPSQASDLKALKIIPATVILLDDLFLEAQYLFCENHKKICCEQSGSKEWLICVIETHIYVRNIYVIRAHISHGGTYKS